MGKKVKYLIIILVSSSVAEKSVSFDLFDKILWGFNVGLWKMYNTAGRNWKWGDMIFHLSSEQSNKGSYEMIVVSGLGFRFRFCTHI